MSASWTSVWTYLQRMFAVEKENQHELTIGGLVVKFPFNPYPPQKALMAKIIRALNNGENALLESPTGSGKSLALLCSALAWQKSEFSKVNVEEMKSQKKCCCKCHLKGNSGSMSSASTSGASPYAGEGTVASPILVSDPAPSDPAPSDPIPSGSTPSTSCGGDRDIHEVVTSSSGLSLTRPPLHSRDEAKVAGNNKTLDSEGSCPQVKREENVKETTADNDKGSNTMDDDDDFKKSRKRLRVPPASDAKRVSKRRKVKGVVYEDVRGEEDHPELVPDSHGHAKWRMEVTGAVGLGVPQSQIMDTGPIEGASDPVKITKAEQFPPVPPVQCSDCDCASAASSKPCKSPESDRAVRQRYSKIYYATRTHKQVAQITHELNKTAYRGTPMSILASREHTCIHPMVSKSKEKNDECKKLLDYDNGVSCPFFHKVQAKLGSQAQLRQLGLDTAWDIEDLVRVGNKVRACPYFATRGLIDEADIIFCPYNYLIDPLIRDQMLIDLSNKVVILDEAHNIEDTAREAASLSITSYQLQEVSTELEDIIPLSPTTTVSYQYLQSLVKAISRWIDKTSTTLPAKGYEQAFGVWSGTDFLPVLDKEFGVNMHSLTLYQKHLEAATEAAMDKNSDHFDEDNNRCSPEPTLTLAAISCIKSILVVMGYLLHNGMKYLGDYRMSLIKSTAMLPKTNNWIRRGRKKTYEKSFVYTLNFWCFNPSVAFSNLAVCRSIILTSGTLSPMTSFASELGVAFPIQLEASHVIPESRTLVRSLSHGPNGVELSATYQNTETYEFKDELGALILGVCQTVPYGILCFMSSYKMLEKLTSRWSETGIWEKIQVHKEIVCEPRAGGKEVFDEVMSTYYEAIEAYQNVPPTGTSGELNKRTGALFFAVCRGKVSEGLDFTDNNARAVITVGIPFPSIKDKQVELKKEYNNEHAHGRGLLPGRDWYEIQAYRALNQALGRCIRHKNDWGALLLVDARYSKGHHYTKGLSKWVRQRVQHDYDFKNCMATLKEFVNEMLSVETGDCSGSECKSSVSSLSPKLTSTAPVGLQASISLSSASFSPSPVHPSTSPLMSTSYFTLNSPAASIPDHFQPSSPIGTSISTCISSSSSTPIKVPAGHRVLPVSLSQSTSLTSIPIHLCQAQSIPGLGPRKSTSTSPRQYPQIIPIKDIIGKERVGSRVDSNEIPPVMVVDKWEASMSVRPHGSMEESTGGASEVFDEMDTTLVYEQDGANEHSVILKGKVLETNERDKSLVNSCQDAGGDSNLASSIPDTPPGSQTIDSPVMFEVPTTCEGASEVVQMREELAKDTAEVDGKNDFIQDALQSDNPEQLRMGTHGTVHGNDVEMDVQNSFVKEILEEAESRKMTACVNRSPSSSDKIPISELPEVGKTEDEEDLVGHVESVGNVSGKKNEGSPLVIRRRKSNTRKTVVHRVNTRSAARQGKSEDGQHTAVVKCPCGQVLASSNSVETVDFKKMLIQHCGSTSSQVTSSSLWQHFQSKKGKFEALLLPVSESKLPLKAGNDEHYNSVWDGDLGICYSFVECPSKCEQCVGVCIHAANFSNSEKLVEKIILPASYKS